MSIANGPNVTGISILANKPNGQQFPEIASAVSQGYHSELVAISYLITKLIRAGLELDTGVNQPNALYSPRHTEHWLTAQPFERSSMGWPLFQPYKVAFKAAIEASVVYSERALCYTCDIQLWDLFKDIHRNNYRVYYSVTLTESRHTTLLEQQIKEAILINSYIKYLEENYTASGSPGSEYGPYFRGPTFFLPVSGSREYNLLSEYSNIERSLIYNYIDLFFQNFKMLQIKRNCLFKQLNELQIRKLRDEEKIAETQAEQTACDTLYSQYNNNGFTFLYDKIVEYDTTAVNSVLQLPHEIGSQQCRFSKIS